MTVEQETLTDKMSAAVDSYIDRLTEGNAEKIVELYAEGATVEDPIGTEVRTTREQLLEFYTIIQNLDDRTATLKWKKVAGDTAVFEFTLVTHTAGMAFEITPVDIMVFNEEGKIVSMRAVWAQEDLKTL
ncbi:putative delta(5)-3-ketosteroid isomerase [Gordonia effusa NBRC 100432]|uniref:Putative delta(5)-3-ketosteroid isomerase n=1 Tax=Gordonia effusa NBRC 100432 TaxID=1077974 RepID=H0R2J0_9ACTN|nr:nuclear transport factor 2 family protein [Gordonia effusa]GAB19291.1 putative delta(5)-3-ketosteroid isomerase [Gordonia effusa NBRC 100432]